MVATKVYYYKSFEQDEEDYSWHEVNNTFGFSTSFDKVCDAITKEIGKFTQNENLFVSMCGTKKASLCVIETFNPSKYIR